MHLTELHIERFTEIIAVASLIPPTLRFCWQRRNPLQLCVHPEKLWTHKGEARVLSLPLFGLGELINGLLDGSPIPKLSPLFFSREEFCEKTSISPIPRPVSSLNMATLASHSQFPVCLTPPPSPAVGAPQPAPKFAAFAQPAEGSSADEGEVMSSTIKRALSCDSVCSDTSVALGDLEEPNITGYICVGLEYDRWETSPWCEKCGAWLEMRI